MAFRDLAASHVSGVFLNTGHFAESFTHTNPADPEASGTVNGVLDESSPSGPLSGSEGERTRRNAVLHLDTNIVVSTIKGRVSQFSQADETVWFAMSIAFEDGVQLVQVISGTLNQGMGGVHSRVQA